MKLLFKICFSALLALIGFGASGAEPKRVLFIHSFGRGFEPYHTFAGLLRSELASQMTEPIDFFEASLESARFTDLDQESPLLEYLQAQFARHHIDLVVPIGGPAAQFVQRRRQQLFPETPMLIVADQRLFNSSNLTTNDTTALTVNEPGLTVEMLLHVLPETTNVVVVMGNSAIERFWSTQIRSELQSYTNRAGFVWLNQLPFSEMLKRCANLPPRSAIFFPLLFVDAAGVPHLEEQAMLKLHEAANAPIFGIWINQLGQGILGGRLMDIEECSRNAANAAVRILHGESPGNIKIPPQRVGPPEFDWRELRRWGIREARLPAGSVVKFRQPTAWELYRARILATTALCLVEGGLIVLLIRNLIRRRKMERDLRESEERLSLAAAAGKVGVWMWDVARDHFWATDNWRRMFGFPPEAVIGYETVLQRVYEKDRSAVDLGVRHALEEKSDFFSEHRVLLPDGAIRWITAHGRVYPGADAKQLRLLGASVDITERKRAEEAARDLSGRLLSAQEEERARLAKELHDGLSQTLALLSVEMEMFGQRLPAEPGQIDAQLKEFSRHAKGISAEVHRISHDLHPAKLKQLGLAVALRSVCREVSTAHGLAVHFAANDAPRVLPEDVALCLYRVAQEAIQNVVKHSQAKNAWVEVTAVDGTIQLRVKDDGRGFEVNAERAKASLGLVSMQERVRLVQGQIAVKSKPGEGTQVEVRLQLPTEKNL